MLAASMILTLVGCTSSPAPREEEPPVARQRSETVTDDAPVERCTCPPVTGCEIVGRYEVGSAAAIERGFTQFTVKRGVVSCDPESVDCDFDSAPPTATIVETSDTCGLWGDFMLLTAEHVYIQTPQSIGEQGGPGWALAPVAGADPNTYEPLPRGFGRDAEHVYERGQDGPLLEDVRTFEVPDCSGACAACDPRCQ
jgi:hypothetical protein